jgi:hypothetical protein
MGGPGVGIPLREPLTRMQLDNLEAWVRSLSRTVDGNDGNWCFELRDTQAVGLVSDTQPDMPFDLGVMNEMKPADYPTPDGTLDPKLVAEYEEERRQWLVGVGFHPAQYIWMNAGTSARINHAILGHMALTLARRYDGWVDLNGAITPPHLFVRLEDVYNPPPGSLEKIHAHVIGLLPGRVAELYYMTAGGHEGHKWVSHVLDVEAFEAWLRHPEFHLIK